MAEYLHNALVSVLQEEEEKLRRAAEQALLDPQLRDSAILQLGRVALLREAVFDLVKILGEQNNGRTRN